MNENNKNANRGLMFLSDQQRLQSLEQLQSELGVSRTTAWRARNKGWFYQNYHHTNSRAKQREQQRELRASSPKAPKPLPKRTAPPEELPWREVVVLTDSQREWSYQQIVDHFHTSHTTALQAKKRGWFCSQKKLSSILPDGKLPDGVTAEDVWKSAVASTFFTLGSWKSKWAQLGLLDDLKQEAALALLRVTGHKAFTSSSWRFTVAQYGVRKALRKLLTRRGFEIASGSMVEDDEISLMDLVEQKLAQRDVRPKANVLFGDNRIFLAKIRLMIGDENWTKLMAWAEHGTRNQPGDIAIIIRHIRQELGLETA